MEAWFKLPHRGEVEEPARERESHVDIHTVDFYRNI